MRTSLTPSEAPPIHGLVERRFSGPVSPYVVQRDVLLEIEGRATRIHRFTITADMIRSLSLMLNPATGLWHVVSFCVNDKTFSSRDNLDYRTVSSCDLYYVFGQSFGYATVARAVRKTRAEIWETPPR